MKSAERAQLRQNLLECRVAIAECWYRAIAPTSFSFHSEAEIRQRLVALTDLAIEVFLSDLVEVEKARAIGAALAQLQYLDHTVLEHTLAVLAEQLVVGLSTEHRAALLPNLTALLSATAAGFLRQAHGMILAQQETIQHTLTAQRSHAEAELVLVRRQLAERQESERRHLASKLHDYTIHQLLAIKYHLEELQDQVRAGQLAGEVRDDAVVQRLEVTRLEVLNVVTQMRKIMRQLRPPALEEKGLIVALEEHVAHLQTVKYGVLPKIELVCEQSQMELPFPVGLCLFRVAQEALRNVLLHAQAHHVSVRCHVSQSEAILQVYDDGQGFIVPSQLHALSHNDHFGLLGILERVAGLDGHVDIQSELGSGTMMSVRVPLHEVEKCYD